GYHRYILSFPTRRSSDLLKIFLNSATKIPETGPNVNVATKTGTSLKSIVKYGGKNGKGNFKNIKIKLIAISILTVSKRLVLLSLDIITPPIHLVRIGGKAIAK